MGEQYRQKQWLEAALEITRLLLAEGDTLEALRLALRRTRESSDADLAAIQLVDADYRDGASLFGAVDGLGLDHLTRTVVPLQGLAAAVVESGKGIVSRDISLEEGDDPPRQIATARSVIGPAMYLPLAVAGKVLGVLFVGWRRDSSHEHISDKEVQLVEMFAGHAALAVQQAQAHRLVLEDRERTADDLRGVVIERLFAASCHLRRTANLVTVSEAQQRMIEVIDEIDEISQQVRSAIFALRHDDAAEPEALGDREPRPSTSSQVLDEIDAAKATLGITPRLVIQGPVDRSVPGHLQGELARAIRAALANTVATHAAPSMVEVAVRMANDQLILTVRDDGRPTGQFALHGALTKLRERARGMGGSCEVLATKSNETIVEWHMPLKD